METTWGELVKMEPKLAALLGEARAARGRGSKSFDNLRTWYGRAGKPGLKAKLLPLVGWERRPVHPVLSTSRSYDVAYFKVLGALEGRPAQGGSE